MDKQTLLLAPWSGPFGGVPPFDAVRVEDFKPALLEGIVRNRAEIAAIADNPAPPTFDNTIAALEDAGRALGRAGTVYGVFASTMNDKAMQAVETEMAPILAAFSDEVIHNAALFARVKAVYDVRESAGLTREQQRLVFVVERNFARHGAALAPQDKARLAAINQRLAMLTTQFGHNVLADEEEQWLTLDSESDLAGLSEQQRRSAASAADAKGLNGKWVIANTRSDIEPFLTASHRRDLRETAFRLWTMRGERGAHDNSAIIGEILALRAEKAKLLGFPTFAHWVTDDQMAKTPDAAMALMMKVWAPAVARVREEVADMQKIVDADGGNFAIAPWDYRYYAEKVRHARYELDANAIKPYLDAEKIVEAAFWAAGQIFGFAFVEVQGVPVPVADVRVFEVRKDGKPAGLFYLDLFARAGKQSGAWMSEYRTQERFKGEIAPIVSCNMNFVKGEKVLLSWDDAVTVFHEFGHALHALNSNVNYPTLAGTNVVRDFVEFPSQIYERWLTTPQLLARFATHYQTGEPMPDALVARIVNAQKFNQGFSTVEYLASAIVDMNAHLAGGAIDPRAFEATILREIGMPGEIVMRHRLPHFSHIFAGEGYAAGYYDYIWADTLVADAAEEFREAPGGFFDSALAKRLHDEIVSVGNSVDAGEAFRRFRGRDVRVDALMRDRGFPATG